MRRRASTAGTLVFRAFSPSAPRACPGGTPRPHGKVHACLGHLGFPMPFAVNDYSDPDCPMSHPAAASARRKGRCVSFRASGTASRSSPETPAEAHRTEQTNETSHPPRRRVISSLMQQVTSAVASRNPRIEGDDRSDLRNTAPPAINFHADRVSSEQLLGVMRPPDSSGPARTDVSAASPRFPLRGTVFPLKRSSPTRSPRSAPYGARHMGSNAFAHSFTKQSTLSTTTGTPGASPCSHLRSVSASFDSRGDNDIGSSGHSKTRN